MPRGIQTRHECFATGTLLRLLHDSLTAHPRDVRQQLSGRDVVNYSISWLTRLLRSWTRQPHNSLLFLQFVEDINQFSPTTASDSASNFFFSDLGLRVTEFKKLQDSAYLTSPITYGDGPAGLGELFQQRLVGDGDLAS